MKREQYHATNYISEYGYNTYSIAYGKTTAELRREKVRREISFLSLSDAKKWKQKTRKARSRNRNLLHGAQKAHSSPKKDNIVGA